MISPRSSSAQRWRSRAGGPDGAGACAYRSRCLSSVFGQTESYLLLLHMTLPEDPFERRRQPCGMPLPHTEVKIINPVTGEIVPCGERGELCCRGYLVMQGYYKMPEKTAEAIDHDGLAAYWRPGDDGRERACQHRGSAQRHGHSRR